MILISANTAAAAPASSVPRKNAIGTRIVHRHRIAPGNIAKDAPKARMAGKREFRSSDGPLLMPEAARVANRFLHDLFALRAEGRFRELPGYVFPAGPAHSWGSLLVGHQDGEGSGKRPPLGAGKGHIW